MPKGRRRGTQDQSEHCIVDRIYLQRYILSIPSRNRWLTRSRDGQRETPYCTPNRRLDWRSRDEAVGLRLRSPYRDGGRLRESVACRLKPADPGRFRLRLALVNLANHPGSGNRSSLKVPIAKSQNFSKLLRPPALIYRSYQGWLCGRGTPSRVQPSRRGSTGIVSSVLTRQLSRSVRRRFISAL